MGKFPFLYVTESSGCLEGGELGWWGWVEQETTTLCQKTLVLSSFLKMCSWIILTFKINQTNKSIALLEGFDSEIVPMSDLTDL